jgi:hypothetical protein
VLIDGDPKMWELKECLRDFFRENQNAVRTNLEFFIALRNKIEHRYVLAIDPHVAGECQAMLLNFDDLLTTKNTLKLKRWSPPTSGIRSARNLSMNPHHLFEVPSLELAKDLPPCSSFRTVEVPKVGNDRSSSDLAIKFVKVDSSQADKIGKQIVAIKEKHIPGSQREPSQAQRRGEEARKQVHDQRPHAFVEEVQRATEWLLDRRLRCEVLCSGRRSW